MATIKRIKNATRVIGKSQGYIGLPLRDEVIFDPAVGAPTHSMLSAWELEANELAALAEGLPLILRVLGQAHPPVMLYVGDEVEDAPIVGNSTSKSIDLPAMLIIHLLNLANAFPEQKALQQLKEIMLK